MLYFLQRLKIKKDSLKFRQPGFLFCLILDPFKMMQVSFRGLKNFMQSPMVALKNLTFIEALQLQLIARYVPLWSGL